MNHINYNAMKTSYVKVFLPIILMVVIASCTSIRVSTDFDRKADFAKYKTFNFSKEVDKVSLNELNRRRLKDAITKEMETKGYQISTTPDVLVNAFVKGKTHYTATANTTSFGGPFGYMRGWGSSNTYVDVDKSIDGTLFIDVIDVSEKKMVWEGVAEGLVNPRTNTREDKLNSVVQQIFKNFPR